MRRIILARQTSILLQFATMVRCQPQPADMEVYFGFVVLFHLLPSCGAGQLASPSWRKPNITMSPADRINVAEAAIEKAISMLSPDAQFDGQSLGYAAQLYSQMAQFDIATNQRKYVDTLKQYFLKAPHRATNFSDVYAYGHAAVTAYIAYNESVFLDYAVQSWWFGRTYTLSSDEVNAGKTPVKNFPIIQVCQDLSTVGGTFWNNIPDEGTIATLGTGNFFVLSALLAEVTNMSLYSDAATESWQFVDFHLRNSISQIQDNMLVQANESCGGDSTHASPDAGLIIEGLTIRYAQTADPQLQTALRDIVNATILDQVWQHPDGVLIHGDPYLLRGLTTFYTRNSIPDLLDDIEHYIAVQFNAVIDLTTVNGTNVYSGDWWGPPNKPFFPTNQSSAIGALLGAINLRNASDSTPVADPPTPSSSTTPVPPPGPRKSSNVAAIVGGVVCAAVALLACALFIWLIRRRRLRKTNSTAARPSPFGIWYNIRRRGKNAENALAAPASTVSAPSSSSKNASARRPAPAPAPPPAPVVPVVAVAPNVNPGGIQPSANLATEELVRMLNERLQGRDWDAEEAPPEYPV
ncbi:hypothetical protein C8R46DRAFT_996167 [Mycena filopes]|nr:hypothetical protein C8R46DRAFT_996167 [Mycena filopes]